MQIQWPQFCGGYATLPLKFAPELSSPSQLGFRKCFTECEPNCSAQVKLLEIGARRSNRHIQARRRK